MSPTHLIGAPKEELDTPVLLADLDKLEANIARMARVITREAGVRWRPHTKAMKTPALAHMLLDAGACGITCAKLGEAEVMAAGGIRDILIANQIVGPQKIAPPGQSAPPRGRNGGRGLRRQRPFPRPRSPGERGSDCASSSRSTPG